MGPDTPRKDLEKTRDPDERQAPIPTVGSFRETPETAYDEREETGGDSGSRPRAQRVHRQDTGDGQARNRARLPQIGADRPIFTLSVAADLLGLHPRTLRIYEEKRLVVPARTAGNRRRYSQNDIQRFQAIRRLTRGGVNLEGVRIILEMADELALLGGDPDTIIERNLQALNEA